MSGFNRNLVHTNPFYDNRPLRVKREGCMWDPLRGNRRLLYDCVWIVSGNPATANPTSTLGVRLGWSKFASKKLTRKLHLIISSGLCEFSSSWLQVTKAQGLRAADASLAAPRRSYFGKPNYLPRGVSLHGLRIVTWLILPVVICLSQRLSHACLSISVIQRNCEWLIKTVIVYLVIEFTWITVVILELIHAGEPYFAVRAVFIR